MAFLAVTSLMRSLEFQFLHPKPRVTLSNKKQIKSLHEKLGDLLVFLDKIEKNGDNPPEMRAVTERIIAVSVKAEDDIEEELLSDHQTKLEESLQRVVDEVEKLVQITMNTTELSNTNLTTVGGSSSSQHTSRVDEEDAMVGHSNELDERSSLCFNGCGPEWYLLATSFKKLIVLDLSKIDFKKGVPQDITDLVFLRYLALASSSMLLKHIPLDKNWNLQTLIISGEDDKDAHELLPPGIWNNLQQLRHLEINQKLQVSIDLVKVQENLQTLYWLSISQCTGQVFMRIPNVKELGIVAGGHIVSGQGLHYLWFLNYLEKLRVQGSDHPLHLPPFYIFPQTLKELTFVSTRMPWKAMSIISMLPNLEVLKLKKFACTGQVWELTEYGGFPQLKVLIISLTDLKYWKANVDYPFPNLERLKLKKCFELVNMPDGIGYITPLQLIKLVYCSDSVVCSANKFKEEQGFRGNYMLDVLDFHTQPGRGYDCVVLDFPPRPVEDMLYWFLI
nr:putative late blight resistance protein homolog R1A-10 isoform X1 [Ipomoea batatas]